MKRILQFVLQFTTLAVVLALVAPQAFAAMDCRRAEVKTTGCAKSCCEGMDGMVMAASMEPENPVSIGQTPCCTVSQTEATLLAAVSEESQTTVVALMLPVTVVLPSPFVAVSRAAEHPPGAQPHQPSLAQLSSFRI